MEAIVCKRVDEVVARLGMEGCQISAYSVQRLGVAGWLHVSRKRNNLQGTKGIFFMPLALPADDSLLKIPE
jgi:hypothetical protein